VVAGQTHRKLRRIYDLARSSKHGNHPTWNALDRRSLGCCGCLRLQPFQLMTHEAQQAVAQVFLVVSEEGQVIG
jgi:hypothetical protein